MTNASVFEKLSQVLREVFDNEQLVATPELTARLVDGWDSLGNVRLFIELESVFGVRFSAAEISSLKNVGQLAQLLEKKCLRPKM